MSPRPNRLLRLLDGVRELLDQVDYRLARTPEEKEEIYRLRYRAYLREGAVKESPEQRVTDQYDDLPNSWTFGIYIEGELYSSVRISVLTAEWRESCSAEAFGEILHPRLDRGEVIIDRPASCRARQGQALPGTALCDAAAGLSCLRILQRRPRLRSFAPSIRRSIAGFSCTRPCRTAFLPGSAETGWIDGREFPGHAGQGVPAFSDDALERLRTADAVRARRRAPFIFAGHADRLVRAQLDRSAAILTKSGGLRIPGLTRFPDANRLPPRTKRGAGVRSNAP